MIVICSKQTQVIEQNIQNNEYADTLGLFQATLFKQFEAKSKIESKIQKLKFKWLVRNKMITISTNKEYLKQSKW